MLENGKERPFDPARDAPALIEAARGIPNLKQLIIDSVVSAVAGDSHKNAEVRRGLQPIVAFASETKSSVIGITHVTKGTVGHDPVERVTGSLAFAAQARVVLMTVKPLVRGGKHRLVRVASNIGPDGNGFEYSPHQEPLPAPYNFSAQRVLWGDKLKGTARDLLNDVEQPDEEKVRPRDTASKFLLQLLAAGPVAVKQVEEEAKAAGLSRATVRRAADDLGITAGKTGFDAGWSWRLPDDATPGEEVPL
jgi:putative DNA primase/helicase